MKDLTKILLDSAYTGNILSVAVPVGTDIPRKTLRKNGVLVTTRTVNGMTFLFPRRMNPAELFHYLIGA